MGASIHNAFAGYTPPAMSENTESASVRPHRGKERISVLTTPEHRTIVAMLAEGSPVWYVAAVTKSDRHHAYAVGARYGYPDREALKRSLQQLTGAGALLPAAA
jgi:hypothetical protein